MNSISGFPPIANKSAEILILGSMPSETSLLKHQYYGHPGNAFWPIMLSLFEHSTSVTKLSYQQRKQLLQYLWTRPYGEVATIIAMLASLKAKKNDDATPKK